MLIDRPFNSSFQHASIFPRQKYNIITLNLVQSSRFLPGKESGLGAPSRSALVPCPRLPDAPDAQVLFSCKTSWGCVHHKFVCDNVPHCEDESDEHPDLCGNGNNQLFFFSRRFRNFFQFSVFQFFRFSVFRFAILFTRLNFQIM